MAKHRSNPSTGLLGLPTHQSKRFLQERKPRGFLAKAVINSSILYVLYWILFACPSGVPTAQSPQVCHRYYHLKEFVATKAVPHLQPYYEQYANPYISKGKPYYEQANAVYGQYARPVVDKSSALYSSYVHPVALKSVNVAKSQYDARLGPKVNKHITHAALLAQKTYQQYIGKHVTLVSAKYEAAVAPYVSFVQAKAAQAYDRIVLPAVMKSTPYVQTAGRHVSHLYFTYAHPRLLDILSYIGAFLDTKVMPTIRRMYYLHVEPQFNKVSERLFRFNVSTGFVSLDKTSPDAVESAVSQSILSSATLSTSLESTVIAGETHTVEATAPTVDAKLQSKIQHGIIDDLLSIAETNIAREGAGAESALKDNLDEILPALVKKEEILCEDYLKQLEKVTLEEVESVEQHIISFAKAQANKGRDTHEIVEDLRPYLIKAGKNIHAHAVEVKAHLSTVMESLQSKVHRATYVVYDQVLAEGQRQKRAPEQKLRYEMEGVTKKELKRLEALDDKIKAVEEKLNLASKRILKGYTKTLGGLLKDTEKKVESLAGGAANKLHTLRNIGPKKITVLDDSEKFGHGYLPIGMMLGAQAIYNQLSTGVYGAPEPTPELPEQVMESIKSWATELPNEVNTDSILSAAKYAASVASEQGVNAASAVSSVMAGVDTDAITSSASSAASVASVQAASAYAAASSAAQKVDTAKLQASVAAAQEYVGAQAADLAHDASSAVYGTKPAFAASVASKASEVIYGSHTPLAESLLDKVHGAYDAASAKLDKAVHGTPVPFTESIASKASEAIYGSEVPVAESILNKAAGAYHDLKDKAADLVHGSEEEIKLASKSAASASSSLSSAASASAKSLSKSAFSASLEASKSLSSASSMASKSSQSVSYSLSSASSLASKSAASVSSLASKSAASASSVASKSSESVRSSASSASSVAAESAASASSLASKSLASASSAGKSVVGEETPIVQSVVDKAWEDYANAKKAVKSVVETVREHVEL